MSDVRGILEQFLATEGVRAAVITGRDGFVIESAMSGVDLDPEGIAAAISSAIGASEIIGTEIGVGDLQQLMLEYSDGLLVISLLGEDAILAVSASKRSNLGNIRYQVKKRLAKLIDIL